MILFSYENVSDQSEKIACQCRHASVSYANGTAVGNMPSNQCKVPPSRGTWEMLIATCTESGDLPTATKCIMEMEAAGMKPSYAVIAPVMKLHAECKRDMEDKQRKGQAEKEKPINAQGKHSCSVDLG